MPGKRKPSKHQITDLKRVGGALSAMTNRPIVGATFRPDGSFSIELGEPQASETTPRASADKALKDWQQKHADKAEGPALGEGEAR
jgi:hypothetical protein